MSLQSGVTFDDFDNEDLSQVKTVPPFWTIKDQPEDKRLDWLKLDWEDKKVGSESRIRIYEENLALYKGIHFRSQQSRDDTFRTSDGDRQLKTPKIVVNHIYDLIETKLSKMSRFRPAITALPRHDSVIDKQAAVGAKDLVESRWGEVDIDHYVTDIQRNTFIYGENIIMVGWDESIGEMIPQQKRALRAGAVVPKLNKSSKIQTEDGDFVKVEEAMRIGDVSYEIFTPDRYFPDREDSWKKMESITIIEFEKVEELRAKFPKKQADIQITKQAPSELELIDEVDLKNTVMKLTFWHRPTRFLPKGRKITYTLDAILEDIDYPYEDKEGNKLQKFPFERLTDIEVPNELHARSTIRNTKQCQHHHNNITSAIARNHGLTSAPKWVVPANAAVTRASLSNDTTIVRFRGPVAPQLVSTSPTPKEILDYPNTLRTWMEQQWGIHSVSRGEPPKQIKAGIALQFLDEQENERATTAIAKRNRLVVGIAQQTLERMQQFYRNDDGRLIKLLGKDNTFMIKKLDESVLDKPYDIKIQNASALPQSRASRTQTLIDLNDSFPGMLRNEQVLDLIDLAQDQKFRDITTTSIRAAESENESIFTGEVTGEPQLWEDQIIHHQSHVRELQERTFKEDLAPERQKTLIEHTIAHEHLMFKKARTNPLFAQKLAALDNFPVFYVPSPEDMAVLNPQLAAPIPDPSTAQGKGGPIGDSGMMPQAIPDPLAFKEGK